MSLERTIKQKLGTSTALVITGASLANGGARESTAVSNAANQHDALVQVRFQLAAGVPGGEQQVLVYAYGSEDGTHYTSPATGADAAVTMLTPTTLALIGAVEVRDNTGTPVFTSPPMSVASAFGWVLPRKWGIVLVNRSGQAFGASNFAASYSGVYQTVE